MTQLMRLLTGAAAVAVVLVAGAWLLRPAGNAVGGPSATPSVSPATSPASGSASPSIRATSLPELNETFTSARHGVSINYPAGWTVSPATRPWPAGVQAPQAPNAELDMLVDPRDATRTFVMVSQPLARDTTPTTWLAAFERSYPQMPAACWPAPDQMEHGTVGGQPAWIHGGVIGCGFVEAIVFAGGRVYELTAYGQVNGIPYDRALFDALLATVTFDPAAADDSPVASTSP